MMVGKSLIAAAIVLSVTVPALAQEFPPKTDLSASIVDPAEASPLEGADALAVHETVTRVYLAEDSRNATALTNLVTDNFVQDHALYGRITGAEAFGQWVLDNPAAFDRYRHVALNIVSRATGPASAEALSYVLVVNAHPRDEATATALPNILALGVVRDRLIKESGKWFIEHRIYDQFAVTASAMADRSARLNASRTLDPHGPK